MATIDELRILITAETRGIREGIREVRRDVGDLESGVKRAADGMSRAFKAVAGVIAALGIAKVVKDSINAASELESAMAGLTSIVAGHGLSVKNANKFIQEYVRDGLVPLTNAVTAYKNLASRGYTEEQIQNVMLRLKDSAAFGRQASYTLGRAVETATEGLKNENSILVDNAGVTKNVAKMWLDYAKARGISYTEMTKQQRIEAEVLGIMEETKFQVGDAAKYTETYAGRIAALSATLQTIKVSLGQAFMPIANLILPLLQSLLNATARVAAYLASFMQALFGVSKAQSAQATSANQAASAQINAGDAATKAGNKAKKAAKEAKNAVASFDELNLIGKKSGGAADDGDAAGAGASVPNIMPVLSDFTAAPIPEEIQRAADRAREIFKQLGKDIKGYWADFAGAWSGLRPALQPFIDMKTPIMQSAQGISRTFVDLKDKVLVPLAKYALKDFIPSLVIGFTQSFAPVIAKQITWAFAEFDKTFKNVTSEAERLWKTVWLPSLEQVKNAYLLAMPVIAGALDGLLTGAINPFVDFMLNDFMIPLSSAMTETLVPLFTGTLAWAVMEFARTSQNAVAAIVDLWSSTFLPALNQIRDVMLEVLPVVAGAWKSLLDNTLKPFVDYALNDFVIPISKAILETLVPILTDTLVWAFREVANVFEWAVNLINDLYKTVLKPVFDLIKEIVLDTLSTIRKTWDEHGKKILEGLTGVINNILKIVQRLWDDILKPIIIPFLDRLKELWEGTFKGIAVQMANFVANLIEFGTMIFNKFISPLINKIIDFLAPAFVTGFNTILEVVTRVIDSMGTVLKGVMTTLNGIITFILGAFTGDWSRAWEGVKTVFKGVFDSFYGIVKLPLGLIIDAINKIIEGFNSISVTIPEIDVFGKKIGGGKIGLPKIPKIPALANGGLAYGPTMAVIGDNPGASIDPEVVSPLSTLKGILSQGQDNREVVSVLYSILNAINSGGGEIVLQIGSTELGRAAANGINEIQRRTGVSPLRI